jgi:hypothetical protein
LTLLAGFLVLGDRNQKEKKPMRKLHLRGANFGGITPELPALRQPRLLTSAIGLAKPEWVDGENPA